MRNRPQAEDAGPHPVDIHVGKRVKLRRTILQISQERMAADIGVTFQQVQKYETGVNRISASRLYDIAKVLNTSVGWFFEELPPTADDQSIADPMQSTAMVALGREFFRMDAVAGAALLAFLQVNNRRDLGMSMREASVG